MNGNECAIKFQNITKDFVGQRALDNVSFEIIKGEIYEIMG